MAASRRNTELYVYFNSILVGTLSYTRANLYHFTYDKDWLTREDARPISLSIPLQEKTCKSEAVYNYFNNLLPDNDIIRKRIQARFQLQTDKCFDLLSSIGRDCIGALQLLPEPLTDTINTIQADTINDHEIAQLLKHYQTAPLGMQKNSDFRISIAGAQEKTALLHYNGRWHLPHETTPTSHIIKLPIGRIEHAGIDLSDSIENEWLCLQILSAYGLPVNQANIISFDAVKTLVVERFDRKWTSDKTWLLRLPQEDLCQALGLSLKYQSDGGPGIAEIMALLQYSANAEADRYQFMKTVFLFWVLGAIDGHGKNFSIFLEANGRYRLTPVYDVLSAYPIADKRQIEWQDLKMAMAVKGKNTHYHWKNIQRRHWETTAQRCGFTAKQMQAIIDNVFDNMDSVINSVTHQLPKEFPEEISTSIFEGMKKVQGRCKG
ncbi:MAG: serine/threonine protein kinase [Legionellales bacterium]|nr:serine/threonine protein kinase [Legionellales bacterium]